MDITMKICSDITIEEALQCQSPSKTSEIYAILISSCGLSNLQTLWDKYKEYMAEDILQQLQCIPSHKLQLKLNVPVMLMQNRDAPRQGNGTRLRITKLMQNALGATILTGVGKGENVIIPRIQIIPTDLPFQFKRVQFLIKLSLAERTRANIAGSRGTFGKAIFFL
ncbi:ATP-dependent DNA helicase [Trichonephila clavipes]|nr:ATP-dependent DNA helicase [Trichonephila clavipes]